MDYKIIVDSCCDMTPQLIERLDATSVPLTMRLGQLEFRDDETLDLNVFMTAMKACTEKVGSAAPAPYSYQNAMVKGLHSFVVTLSSRLSGSYASAVTAKTLAEEDDTIQTHVFDSKSASAGEILIAIKIRELLQKGLSREKVIQTVSDFITGIKTYFVLENYDNLMKNGRLSKVTEKLISFFNIKLIMGSDGDGSIALYAKVRGVKQTIDKMVSFIEQSGKKTDNENLVITHCNNISIATQLCEAIEKHFHFKEIFVIPTGGLSTLYADDKGIIMAF